MNKYLSLFLIQLFLMSSIWGQSINANSSNNLALDSNSKIIEFLSAGTYNVKKIDSFNFVILVGNVKLRQGKTLLFADSLALNTTTNNLEGFGHIHINDADSVHTYADYLKYNGNTKKANLRRKVKLTDGKGILTTDSLDYDVSLKMGVYKKGGKLVRSKTTLTSTEGVYYGITRDVIFRKKVELIDPENAIFTDTLEYNTYSQLSNFISPTKIISGSRIIRTTNGNYNTGTRKGYLYERSSIDDSTYTFISDEMAINDSLAIGEFRGNAIFRTKDSLSFDMMANNIKTDRNNSILLATELPLLLIKQKKDTLFVHADTLYSAKLATLHRTISIVRDSISSIVDTTKDKYFEAFHNVIIFSDSLQAKCDSMFYSMADSTIRLVTNPIVWTNNNQITGDTIYLYINNKKPEALKVFNNAFAINKLDSIDLYNQMKGNQINAWFDDGKIAKMITKGGSESIYFVQDDKKELIGMNRSTAQIMTVEFEQGEPAKVKWVNQLQGLLTPIKKVKKEDELLRNFHWLEAIRPKTKFDAIAPVIN